MNRKKKMKTILTKRLKKTQKRLAPENPNKPRYISKAERAEMEAGEQTAATENPESTDPQ